MTTIQSQNCNSSWNSRKQELSTYCLYIKIYIIVCWNQYHCLNSKLIWIFQCFFLLKKKEKFSEIKIKPMENIFFINIFNALWIIFRLSLADVALVSMIYCLTFYYSFPVNWQWRKSMESRSLSESWRKYIFKLVSYGIYY